MDWCGSSTEKDRTGVDASDENSTERVFENRTTGPNQKLGGAFPRHALSEREITGLDSCFAKSRDSGGAACFGVEPHGVRVRGTRRVGPVFGSSCNVDSGVLRHGIDRAGLGLQPAWSLHHPVASTSRS